MKVYRGSFRKKNGESRNMVFAQLHDLPTKFLEKHVSGTGSEQSYPEGMELVWDLEADNFRIFNWKTAEEAPQEISIDESYFT